MTSATTPTRACCVSFVARPAVAPILSRTRGTKSRHKAGSTSCLIEANWKGRDIPCVDSEANRSWDVFWNSYPDAVSAFYGQPIQQSVLWPDLNRTMQGMLSQGCSYLSIAPFDSPTSAHFCDLADLARSFQLTAFSAPYNDFICSLLNACCFVV